MSAHLVEVVITGHLGPSLTAALEGYDVVGRDDGTSSVTGMVGDQAELRALLAVFDGLNIEVVSVNRVTPA
ncbi:hypothetical protein [Microbacterium gallinarum]|jgi:hypothetical protein|uniref:Uncharacterized protein n=1 Tax=Microbacterium gallinarum TaxID=2762209 RepID=A0ABR8X138_9MICO|nr:hypothetical protein [Microbacterium gallinarum]MBD8022903.1 hypothetical protein [Microbacterium gallinarum]